MGTVLRASGLAVRIFKDDHPPAHVHVVGDGEAKVNLAGPDGRPVLVYARRMTRADIQRAYRIVVENQSDLLARWSEIHG